MIAEAIQFPNFDPAALTIPVIAGFGPFHLRWYALAYIAGLFLGWRYMVWLARKDRLWAPGKPSMSAPQIDDFVFWATIGVIVGGRLGYVLFYKPDMIWRNPIEIVQTWEGGMSFHGGLIGVALAALFFVCRVQTKPSLALVPRLHVDEDEFAALAKKRATANLPEEKRKDHTLFKGVGWLANKEAEQLREKARSQKITLLGLGDLAAAAAPIGLFFGRLANFINGELWGRPTDAPWGVVFPAGGYNWEAREWVWFGTEVARHPSQLYEAFLEGVVLFVAIAIATLKFDSLKKPGLNTGMFLLGYGLFRGMTEFVREPDQHMPEALQGYVTMGLLLSIPMILAGAWLIWNSTRKQTATA